MHELTWDDVPNELMEAGFLCVCRQCGAAFRSAGEWLEAPCRPEDAAPAETRRDRRMVYR